MHPPDARRDFLEALDCRLTFWTHPVVAKRLRDLGADAVICTVDIADNSGPFYNPQHMDR